MTKFATPGTGHALLKPAVELASGLGLTATPTFAAMAWVSAAGSPAMSMCSSSVAPINDMALMYLLMSLFHLSPWLRLLSKWRASTAAKTTQIQGD